MIEVTRLSKRYGKTVAVDDLSFTVAPSVVTGFLGPNGAGEVHDDAHDPRARCTTAGAAFVNGRPYAMLAEPMREVGALLNPDGLVGELLHEPGSDGRIRRPRVRITDEGMLRAVLVYIGLSAMTYASLGAAIAVFTRNAGFAVVLSFLLSIIPVITAPLLGRRWGDRVPRFVPGAVVESLAGVAEPGSPGYLPTPAAALVLFCWLAVFIAAAFVGFTRHDS